MNDKVPSSPQAPDSGEKAPPPLAADSAPKLSPYLRMVKLDPETMLRLPEPGRK